MAIIKEIESDFGVPFVYHKIKSVRIENDPKTDEIILIMTVASYATKQARAENKNAVFTQCSISNADFALTPFYRLLKAKFPEYAGEDDFDNGFKGGERINPYVTYAQNSGGTFNKWTEGPDEEPEEAVQNDPAEPEEEITESEE